VSNVLTALAIALDALAIALTGGERKALDPETATESHYLRISSPAVTNRAKLPLNAGEVPIRVGPERAIDHPDASPLARMQNGIARLARCPISFTPILLSPLTPIAGSRAVIRGDSRPIPGLL
jgi:hypothetical protein